MGKQLSTSSTARVLWAIATADDALTGRQTADILGTNKSHVGQQLRVLFHTGLVTRTQLHQQGSPHIYELASHADPREHETGSYQLSKGSVARVLWAIATGDASGVTAAEIVETLDITPSALSNQPVMLFRSGLITRAPRLGPNGHSYAYKVAGRDNPAARDKR